MENDDVDQPQFEDFKIDVDNDVSIFNYFCDFFKHKTQYVTYKNQFVI